MKKIRMHVGAKIMVVDKQGVLEILGEKSTRKTILIGMAKTSHTKQKISFREFWLHPLLGINMYPVFEHILIRYTSAERLTAIKVLGVGSKANL